MWAVNRSPETLGFRLLFATVQCNTIYDTNLNLCSITADYSHGLQHFKKQAMLHSPALQKLQCVRCSAFRRVSASLVFRSASNNKSTVTLSLAGSKCLTNSNCIINARCPFTSSSSSLALLFSGCRGTFSHRTDLLFFFSLTMRIGLYNSKDKLFVHCLTVLIMIP